MARTPWPCCWGRCRLSQSRECTPVTRGFVPWTTQPRSTLRGQCHSRMSMWWLQASAAQRPAARTPWAPLDSGLPLVPGGAARLWGERCLAVFTTSNLLYILAGDAGWICRCGPRCNLSIVYLYGSLHESYVHERLKTYVCILYCSPCAYILQSRVRNVPPWGARGWRQRCWSAGRQLIFVVIIAHQWPS